MSTRRVFVLGAGRAGVGLARALVASGIDVVGLHGRRPASGDPPVTAGPLPAGLAAASVVLVAVRDAQLSAALHELAQASLAERAVVLHASGSVDAPELALLRARGHAGGTFHPLVPVADPARAAAILRGAWIGIDGDPEARTASRELATALGARTLEIPAGEKGRYHAAAVLASNFLPVMLAMAEQVLRDTGLESSIAGQALRPLFAAAAENAVRASGADALTGPVARGDVETVRAHLAALRGEPDVLAVYRALSRAAVALARERGTEPARLQAIERLLEAPASGSPAARA